MTHIESFIRDLLDSETTQRKLNLGVNRLNHMLEELEQLQFNNCRFLLAEPDISETVKQSSQKATVAVSAYRDNNQVNRPKCIRKVNDEYWVGNTYNRISRFNSSWAFLGYWKGEYGDPNRSGTSYAYVSSFAVDTTNNRIYIAMEWRHIVRSFNLETGEFLWQYGDGSPGHMKDNRIWNPVDVEVLPNGNVLICSYNGYGQIGEDEGANHGFLVEVDSSTGQAVACRKMYKPNTDGNAWSDSVSNPIRARILSDGNLYVSMYNRHHVGCWDPETWDYVDSFTKPQGMDVGSVYPRGLCLTHYTLNELTREALVVACNGPKSLGAVDKETHSLVWLTGYGDWDDKREAENNPLSLWDIWDVLEIEPGFYAVADYGNNRISIVPSQMTVEIEFKNIPDDVEIKWVPKGFNKETRTMTVPITKVGSIDKIPIVL